jgi:hypothetical protein
MWPQTRHTPDPMHNIFADTQLLGQLPARPVCGTIARLPAGCRQNLGLQPRRDYTRFLAGMPFLRQAIDTLFQETLSPFRDGRSRGAQSFLNLCVATAFGQHQNQTSAKHVSCRQRPRHRHPL